MEKGIRICKDLTNADTCLPMVLFPRVGVGEKMNNRYFTMKEKEGTV